MLSGKECQLKKSRSGFHRSYLTKETRHLDEMKYFIFMFYAVLLREIAFGSQIYALIPVNHLMLPFVCTCLFFMCTCLCGLCHVHSPRGLRSKHLYDTGELQIKMVGNMDVRTRNKWLLVRAIKNNIDVRKAILT